MINCSKYFNQLTVDAIRVLLRIDGVSAPATANKRALIDAALIEYAQK